MNAVLNEFVPKVDHEIWLAKRVYGEKAMAFFEGVTRLDQRRQRMRETITLLDMGDKLMAKSFVTFRAAFERLYREPL